jgi:hypothetical protein
MSNPVYCVFTKTFFVLFSTLELAQKFIDSQPAELSKSMFISKMDVYDVA